jgi:predicted O-methyltransferase YrrM
MRSFQHWTPRYLINRLSLQAYERKHPDSPWLTHSMIETLETWLRPSDIGLEFGSGRSTLWFAKRVGHLISVEHHPQWYAKVKQQLHHTGLADRVDYRLLEDGKTDSETSEYVKVAREIQPHSLDFCLIDGVARDHCTLASLDKIKPGGILIIDNVNNYWPRESKSFAPGSRNSKDGFASEKWQQCAEIVSDWRCIWTSNGIWDTALWVKSEEGNGSSVSEHRELI